MHGRGLLVELKRASSRVRKATSGAKDGLSQAAVAGVAVGGLVVVGVVASVLVRRRKR